MPKFVDTLGSTWDVEINGGTVRRAQRSLGVDIGKPNTGESPWLVRFEQDIAFKVDLLYVICQPEIRERGWTDEEFAGLLGGEVLRDASVAVYQALTDFFLNLGMTEPALATQVQIASLPEIYGADARRSQSVIARRLGMLCAS